MEQIITNTTESVKFSHQAMKDVLDTQEILKELNQLDKLIVDLIDYDMEGHKREIKALEHREDELRDRLTLMWDGTKYNNSIRS